MWAGDLVTPVCAGSAGCHQGARPVVGGQGGKAQRHRGSIAAAWGALSCACVSFSAAAMSMSCALAQGRGASVCAAPAAAAGGLELSPRRQARWPSAASAATGWYTQQRGTPRVPLSVLCGDISDQGSV